VAKVLPRGQKSEQFSHSGIANRRLLAELKQLEEFPLNRCQVSPREENILQWTAVIEGPENTVYENGTFFVELLFSESYPFVAPKVSCSRNRG
jgi:ubiquitin-protein ligase